MKRSFTTPSRMFGAVAICFAALVASMLSCGRDGGPPTAPADDARYSRAFVIEPVFPPMFVQAGGASSLVPFDHVHIMMLRVGGGTALDTAVTFPAGTDEVTLHLTVRLASSAPAAGEPLVLSMDYVNASGATVFHGGPVTVTATPPVAGHGPPPPIQLPVEYTGPGASAARVRISPRTAAALGGDAISFSAQALDAGNATVPNTPVFFSVSDGPATVNANGSGTAGAARGTAHIIAQLLTGPADTATLAVQPRPSALAPASGSGQSGVAGSTLPAAIVVRVTAADALGVSGVTVSFAAGSGGSAGNPTVTTDANGNASTTWTLGQAAGSQTLTVNAAGLTPLSVTATATPKPATKLVLTGAPLTTPAGAAFGVTVTAQDVDGNTATAFAGTVLLALSGAPAGGVLSGPATATAVSGVATFTGLALNRVGTSYVLTASSGALASAVSASIAVTPGPATNFIFTTGPATIVAGTAMPAVVVTVTDANGNVATPFTGTVGMALGNNPGGGALSGTRSTPAIAGVATFPGLSVDRAASGYTLVASASGIASATSSAFNVALGPPATCGLVSGGGQTASVNTTLAPIVVVVRDAGGNAVPSVTVSASVIAGGGSLTASTQNTDGLGQATFSWKTGLSAGAQQLAVVCAGGGSVLVSATATASLNTIAINTGNSQSGFVGATLAVPLAVKVTDALAAGVPGVTVNWAVVSGGGSVGAATSVTNASGIATISFTLGATPGANTATATAAGITGSPLTFSATGTAFSFASVSSGGSTTCALSPAGAAYCWGWNASGQVGDGSTTDRHTEVPVTGGLTFAKLSAGQSTTCGITPAGAAWCWGNGFQGELGNGTLSFSPTPVAVSGGLVFSNISVGYRHVCGLTTAGAAYCWGYHGGGSIFTVGGLGDGGFTGNQATPVPVSGGIVFASLSAGTDHTCGLDGVGAAYCWGVNNGTPGSGFDGRIGDSTGTARATPVAVYGGLVFGSISAGANNSCGVTVAGAAYCWGNNSNGQLGNGTSLTPGAYIPSPISGGIVFSSLGAGNSSGDPHVCGLDTTGAAWCWGSNTNTNGALGDNTTNDRYSPVQVVGGLVFTSLSVGADNTCGLTAAGVIYCWGMNGNGQIGDGTVVARKAPATVIP